MKLRIPFLLTAGVAAVAMSASTALAGGFALKERSAKAQGVSFAGATAGSGGLQSMGFNPAAIGMVEEAEISGGLAFIQPIADGVVSTTGESVDADRFAGLANSYVGYRFDPEFLVGLSLYTPFGLVTQYEPTSTVANDALTSKLQTFVFAPTFAYQPDPSLTLAFSGNIIYADARLTSGLLNLEGDRVSAGFSAGVMWKPTPSTQIGLAYDNGYDLTLLGTGTFSRTGANALAAAASNPALVGLAGVVNPVEASAALPRTVSAGIIQSITTDIRLMGEIQWQQWSVFDEIETTFSGAATGIVVTDEQNYDDAFFIAVGGEYDATQDLTLRLGAAWDQTPTNDDFLAGQVNSVNATNRTARVPDEDRLWLSVGATYDMNDHMSLDLGYSYLFALEDPVVGLRNAAPGTQVVYDGGAHIFSIGGSLKF
ncbi:MAG: outer membrane protein transport protein [Pseudomonadota bacterium]